MVSQQRKQGAINFDTPNTSLPHDPGYIFPIVSFISAMQQQKHGNMLHVKHN
jgi:hypothetical protein